MGRKQWNAPEPFGPDGWQMLHKSGKGSVLVTTADHDGNEWTHASIAWTDRLPTYYELSQLHEAVWPEGFAYQVFPAPDQHINIHQFALHLWGLADGKNVLPDFGIHGTI